MWSVFRVPTGPGWKPAGAGTPPPRWTDLFDQAAGKGIVTRGCYDLQGMRADADYMFWWVAPTSDDLQEMYAASAGPGSAAAASRSGR
jgi:peroxiredoxin